jgi:hypothetical protein
MAETTGIHRPAEVVGGDTDFYSVFTLIDITDSGIATPKHNLTGYYQAQNLNTFIQTLGLRTQPILSSVTRFASQDLTNYAFGTAYAGNHTVWLLKFASSTDKAWFKDDNYTHWLVQDFLHMPVHTQLTETANIVDSIETVAADSKNTYFIFSKNI